MKIDLPIHPDAARLPTLSGDEFANLVDDIRANGQRNPITVLVDGDGTKQVVDGRHRLQACPLAGVEPRIREVTLQELGGDIAAFVISANVVRRHLKPGQLAMVCALFFPDAPAGGPSAATETRNKLRVSGELVRQARAVLRQSRDTANLVLNDKLALGTAYRDVDAAGGAARLSGDAYALEKRSEALPENRGGAAQNNDQLVTQPGIGQEPAAAEQQPSPPPRAEADQAPVEQPPPVAVVSADHAQLPATSAEAKRGKNAGGKKGKKAKTSLTNEHKKVGSAVRASIKAVNTVPVKTTDTNTASTSAGTQPAVVRCETCGQPLPVTGP